MITWKPIKNINIKDSELQANNKVNKIQKMAFLGYFLIFVTILIFTKIKDSEVILNFILITVIVSLFYFWLKHRRNYVSLLEKSKNVSKLYTEDYSWKDSLIMLGILLAGCIGLFFFVDVIFRNGL